jgi:AcrR family transcriptional regulator
VIGRQSSLLIKESERARKRIVDGARKHFFVHGFRKVTTDELAAELGMSKKTLYKYFRSKTGLVEAVLEVKFGELELQLAALAEEKLEFKEGLGRVLTLTKMHVSEVQPSFVRDLRKEEPELFELVQSRRRELIRKHFTDLLLAGRKKGMVRTNQPVELMVEVLLGLFDSILTPDRLVALDLSLKQGVSLIMSIFLDGVLLDSGGKSKTV